MTTPAAAAVAAEGPAEPGRGPRRRRLTGWDLLVLVGANAVAVVGLWWRQGGISEIHDTAGLLTSLGRVTGMVGALLALVQLVLLARLPVLDTLALDRVNGWHRWNGIACVALLVAHTVLITAGYALADGVGLGREIGDLLGDYSGVLIATIGLVLLVAVAVTSARAARRRLGRRAWHAVHLTVVPGGRARVQPPARHRARVPAPAGRARVLVGAVRGDGSSRSSRSGSCSRWSARSPSTACTSRGSRPSAPGVVTVEIGGDGLDRLGARAGSTCTGASSRPGSPVARAGPVAVGRARGRRSCGSRSASGPAPAVAATLRPGTRVIAEGPAGGLTSASRRRPGWPSSRAARGSRRPARCSRRRRANRARVRRRPRDRSARRRGRGSRARPGGRRVLGRRAGTPLTPSGWSRSSPTSPSATCSSPARATGWARSEPRCAPPGSPTARSGARGSGDGPRRPRAPRRARRRRDGRRGRAPARRPRAAAADPARLGRAEDRGRPRPPRRSTGSAAAGRRAAAACAPG